MYNYSIGEILDQEQKDKALQLAAAASLCAASGGVNIIACGSALFKQVEFITSLFKNKPNPNDWQGWDEQDRNNGQWDGSSVRGYVLNDGDSVENEALNIVSYIKSKGIEKLVKSGHPVTVQGTGWRDVTIDEIINKIERGGFKEEAEYIKNAYKDFAYVVPQTVTVPVVPNIIAPAEVLDIQTKEPAKASTNILFTVAIIGVALFALSKIKK
jgi:uncharacterized Zn ribbon protein